MALILRALERLDFPVACKLECAEIIQPRNGALAEHLEEFLPDAAVAVCQIEQIGNRAVGELNHDCHVIRRELRPVRQA